MKFFFWLFECCILPLGIFIGKKKIKTNREKIKKKNQSFDHFKIEWSSPLVIYYWFTLCKVGIPKILSVFSKFLLNYFLKIKPLTPFVILPNQLSVCPPLAFSHHHLAHGGGNSSKYSSMIPKWIRMIKNKRISWNSTARHKQIYFTNDRKKNDSPVYLHGEGISAPI